MYNIRQARKYLTSDAAATAIHAFVTSRLDYANALLYGLPKKDIGRLQRVQNFAARLLTGSKTRDHITPVLEQLHWLPMAYRIEFKVLVLAFKAIHGLAPSYLCEVVHKYIPGRTLRSSNAACLLVEPKTRLKIGGDRAFSKAAPVLWNRLPSALRSLDSLDEFQRHLKTHLFRSAYCAL